MCALIARKRLPRQGPLFHPSAHPATLAFRNMNGRAAPALGLPEVTWDFNLFVHEKNHTALRVLTYTVGPWQRLVV